MQLYYMSICRTSFHWHFLFILQTESLIFIAWFSLVETRDLFMFLYFSNSILQLVELLSVRAPSPETKLKLLKEIAEEHELDWDPASTETDLFKSHEDLLVSTPVFAFLYYLFSA